MHPLVTQLRFARSEFQRVLAGVSAEDGTRRLLPSNSLSWTVAHMANQEQRFWLLLAQGPTAVIYPDLHEQVGFGKPASIPEWDEAWVIWHTITHAVDAYLEPLTSAELATHFEWRNSPVAESKGTMLLRNIYHYWFHTGEAHGLRQQMGHLDLPQFVGDMTSAVYTPE
ncbi:MAG: DinB family protein [Chloroflexi bacterium]|nr:DinB family protein [Chloroflexota bacterium]